MKFRASFAFPALLCLAACNAPVVSSGDPALLQPSALPVSPAPSLAPSASPSVSPTPSPSPTPAPVSYKVDVVPVLSTFCYRCHAGGSEFSIFSAEGDPSYRDIKDNIAAIIREIEAKRMPMNKPEALKPAQLEKLKAWRAAGMPNN